MFVQQLVNGLMLGGAYALVAIGYTLIFGVLNLLHLAHGDIFMVGAYVGLALTLVGFPPWATLGGAMLAAAALGVVVERVAFRPVRSRGSHVTPLMTTIAVGLVLQHVVVKIFGAEPVAFPAPFAAASLHLGPVTLSTLQLLILGTSVALMALLELFLRSTPTGMAIRATAENPTVAGLMGINVSLAIVTTFAIASALAGAAGVLLAWNFTGLSPFFGVKVGLKGLAIMLLGGLGNVTGAMVGGLVIGVVEVLSVAYLASSYRDAFAFAVMILILLVRPTGLLGAGSRAAEARVLSDHAVSILIFAGIDVIMALSFFLPASAGQLSAGQGGFMALGAYTSAYLTVHHQTPFPLALAAGGLVGGLVGLAVGFPALRLRGLYLVLVTFGFGEMVRVLFLNAPAFGGPVGFAGIPAATTIWYVLGLLVVLVYFFTRVSGSRMGRAFAALRDDEAAAEAMGVNSTYVKLAAFAAGGVIAGLGGGLYAHYTLFIDPEAFGVGRSLFVMLYAVFGGLASFWGAVAGATILSILPELLRWVKDWREILYGLLVLIMMLVRPQGLLDAALLARLSARGERAAARG